MEESPLKYEIWAAAIWLIAGSPNGISSCEFARALGICRNSAWFLLHRIRFVMSNGFDAKFAGTIEADVTLVGGIEKNKHESNKLKQERG